MSQVTDEKPHVSPGQAVAQAAGPREEHPHEATLHALREVTREVMADAMNGTPKQRPVTPLHGIPNSQTTWRDTSAHSPDGPRVRIPTPDHLLELDSSPCAGL